MADGRGRGPNDIETPFVFVRHGDPLPLDWMARHLGWVKFPATLVPRPAPRPVVPSAPWDASAAGEAAGFGPTSRPVSVGAPVVQRRRVPVHRLPTGTGGMDMRDAVDAYRQASETMDMAASAYLASVAGRSGMTERVPTSPVAAALDAHTPEIDGSYHGHTHHGEAAKQFGHSVSISEAQVSGSFVDIEKASSSPEGSVSGPERSSRLSSLLGLSNLTDNSVSMVAGGEKLAPPNYHYVADDGMPGNNQAQNNQFRDVVVKLQLTYSQKQALHRTITGENLGYHGILALAIEMFGK